MREVVLLQKIRSGISLEDFDEILSGLCKGLRVELTSSSVVENGWIKISVSGEDEKVAARFLGKKLGSAPIAASNVEQFSVLRGRVVYPGRSKLKILVDVGIFSPKPVYALIPLQRLQGQLVDGKKFALKQIIELFGLVDGFPLEIRVIKIDADELKAELTEKQLELYSGWIDSRVDRLAILGTFRKRVKEAVKKAKLRRDVLGIESLDVLEHVVVCSLGTDAKGLVPQLGRLLFTANFVPFSPRRVLKIVSGRW